MLRVSRSDTSEGARWRLSGDLAGPWVDELRSSWRNSPGSKARMVVDLGEVTFIDEAGERLLSEMQSAGVELIAAGIENEHLIATLEEEGGRPLRRRLEHLGPCRQEPKIAESGDRGDETKSPRLPRSIV